MHTSVSVLVIDDEPVLQDVLGTLLGALDTFNEARGGEVLESGPELEGIFLTMLNERTRMGRHVAAKVAEEFGPVLLETSVPRTTRLSEMALRGKPSVIYDRRSPGSRAYFNLADEIVTLAKMAQRYGGLYTPHNRHHQHEQEITHQLAKIQRAAVNRCQQQAIQAALVAFSPQRAAHAQRAVLSAGPGRIPRCQLVPAQVDVQLALRDVDPHEIAVANLADGAAGRPPRSGSPVR